MSSGEQEALKLAEAHDRTVVLRKALNSGVKDNASKLAEATAAELRRLVAEREADRAAMREAIAAGQRWIYAMDKWLATGVPAHPEESKSIYEQQGAAISLLKERIE